jgi:hypothetical protein
MDEKVKKYIAGDTMCLFDLDKMCQNLLREYSAKRAPGGRAALVTVIRRASMRRVEEGCVEADKQNEEDSSPAPINFREAEERKWTDEE